MRLDFRQELQLLALVRSKERLSSSSDVPDLVLFARVLENDIAIGSIHSVSLRDQPPQAILLPRQTHTLLMPAIARPGKYKLEVALLNRETGRYSTRYENLTVNGKSDDLLGRSMEGLSKFEFAAVPPPENREDTSPQQVTLSAPLMIGLSIGIRGGWSSPKLNVSDFAISSIAPPRFVVDRPGELKLTVFSVLSPPAKGLEDENARHIFDVNLTNLLSALTRFDVVHGSSDLLALDLGTRTRAFDRVSLKDVQLDSLRSAITRDRSVVSLKELADRSNKDEFLRDELTERLREAEADTSGATHAIIVVGARTIFRNQNPIPVNGTCPCKIFYVRFGLSSAEADDMPRLLSPYRPHIIEPASWPEFREELNTIYEQLAQ